MRAVMPSANSGTFAPGLPSRRKRSMRSSGQRISTSERRRRSSGPETRPARRWPPGRWRPGRLNDRRILLFGTSDTKPRLWDVEKQRDIGAIGKADTWQVRLPISPDGRRFLTSDRKALYLWGAADAKLLHTFPDGDEERGG